MWYCEEPEDEHSVREGQHSRMIVHWLQCDAKQSQRNADLISFSCHRQSTPETLRSGWNASWWIVWASLASRMEPVQLRQTGVHPFVGQGPTAHCCALNALKRFSSWHGQARNNGVAIVKPRQNEWVDQLSDKLLSDWLDWSHGKKRDDVSLTMCWFMLSSWSSKTSRSRTSFSGRMAEASAVTVCSMLTSLARRERSPY